MGVTIWCKKTGTSYDLGYGGFSNLRDKVAELCSKEFGKHYACLIKLHSTEEFEEFDRKTKELLDRKVVSVKVVDFCLQSDGGGKIRYGACKEIYNRIKDYDDDICYGYAGRPDCMKFKDFVALVKECYENKSDLVWG